jgi:hypothetical protein
MANDTLPVEHLFTMTCTTAPAITVRDAPQGTRLLYAVTGGTVEGDHLRATVVPSPGGDWASVTADGTVRVDARLVLQPEAGSPILFTYTGVAARGADGSVHIRAAGQFEAGPGPHSWLNAIQAVGIGRTRERQVTYDVYRLL